MRLKIPALHRHKASNRARVSWKGRHIYFGAWGAPETEEAYRRWAAELVSGGAHTPTRPGAEMLISELAALYLEHCRRYYPETSTMHPILLNATERLVGLYGSTQAAKFGPRALRAVRATWLEDALSRNTVNKYVGCIKRMFRWAAEMEHIDAAVYQALSTLTNLHRKRSTARETRPIEPVPEAHLEAVLAIAPRVIGDMIRVQTLSGARPGEVCALRRGDIDTTGDVWIATIREHKGSWRDDAKPRLVPFGPRAQALLKPYLLRPDDAYIFDPRESIAEKPAAKGRRREGQPDTPRKTDRTVRDHYDTSSYRRAINRLCDRAGLKPADRWNPNQLRKLAATKARERFGLDAAQVLLGHASADITQVYARVNQARLVEIAKELG